MFVVILITFVITALAMTVVFMVDRDRQNDALRRSLIDDNERLRRDVDHYCFMDHQNREQAAYNQGLYVGRHTDTLYRQTLAKFCKSEQTNVMMNGVQEVENE